MLLLFLTVLALYLHVVNTQCHNNCNKRGICNTWSECQCFPGYEGTDCSSRTCPLGPRIADIPYNYDQAHQMAACSGRGKCISSLGACDCDPGFSGANCGKTACPNDCSRNGQCISLRSAASGYDGYKLNHTTTYNLWDADLIYGCKCDPGWGGHDCSERYITSINVDNETLIHI